MRVNLFTKHLSEQEKAIFEKTFAKRLPSIEKLLSKFDDDTVLLDVTAEHFARKNAYVVKMDLQLPGKKTLYVSEDDHTIEEALDLAKAKLVIQLRKDKEKHQRGKGRKKVRE